VSLSPRFVEVEAPAGLKTRFVQLCPEHRVVLLEGKGDRFQCPHGKGHVPDEWLVLDRQKGIVVSRVNALTGLAEELQQRLAAVQIPPRRELEEKDMGAALTKKRHGVAKFENDRGALLFLKLISVPAKGSPWRVTWETVEKIKGRASKRAGTAALADDEAEARQFFAAQVKEALKAGWKESHYGRGVVVKPIPAAK
jgi:hypothetical protein